VLHTCGCVQKKDDPLVEWVQQLQDCLPAAQICCHWSIEQHYKRGPDATHPLLQDHIRALQTSSQRREGLETPSLLLVNGSGPKRPYNTVTALEMLQAGHAAHGNAQEPRVQIHVCFNP
jgi:hypothetical protein